MFIPELVDQLAALGCNDWESAYDACRAAETADPNPGQKTDSAAIRLAMISEYIDSRWWGGKTHESALESARERASEVRRAMGYSDRDTLDIP
jgi:hypothetical protein